MKYVCGWKMRVFLSHSVLCLQCYPFIQLNVFQSTFVDINNMYFLTLAKDTHLLHPFQLNISSLKVIRKNTDDDDENC